MQGLMMDYQLNVPAILRRAEQLYGDSEIVSRLPDKSWHRFTYADFVSRAKRLAVALREPRPRRRRPGRHAHVEPPRAPRGVPRRARRAASSPTRSTSGSIPTTSRTSRRTPATASSSSTRCSGRSSSSSSTASASSTSSRSATATRPTARSTTRSSSRPQTTSAFSTATSTSAPRPGCVTRAGRPACRRASSTRTASIAIHALTLSGALGMTCNDVVPSRRPDVPRERVVLPVLLHPRRREAGVSRPAPRPRRACSRRSRPKGDDHAPACRRSGCGILQRARREPRSAGISRRCGR